MITEKVFINMDYAPKNFDLRSKVLGVNGSNLDFIRNDTGVGIILKGSFGDRMFPLHLHLMHAQPEPVIVARVLCQNLIETVKQELDIFMGVVPRNPHATPLFPPPNLQGLGQQNNVTLNAINKAKAPAPNVVLQTQPPYRTADQQALLAQKTSQFLQVATQVQAKLNEILAQHALNNPEPQDTQVTQQDVYSPPASDFMAQQNNQSNQNIPVWNTQSSQSMQRSFTPPLTQMPQSNATQRSNNDTSEVWATNRSHTPPLSQMPPNMQIQDNRDNSAVWGDIRSRDGRGNDGRGNDIRSFEGRDNGRRYYDDRGNQERGNVARSLDARENDNRFDSRNNPMTQNVPRFEERDVRDGGNDRRNFDFRGNDARSYDGRSLDGRGDDGHGHDGRGHEGRSHDGRSLDGRGNDGRGYNGPVWAGSGLPRDGRSVDRHSLIDARGNDNFRNDRFDDRRENNVRGQSHDGRLMERQNEMREIDGRDRSQDGRFIEPQRNEMRGNDGLDRGFDVRRMNRQENDMHGNDGRDRIYDSQGTDMRIKHQSYDGRMMIQPGNDMRVNDGLDRSFGERSVVRQGNEMRENAGWDRSYDSRSINENDRRASDRSLDGRKMVQQGNDIRERESFDRNRSERTMDRQGNDIRQSDRVHEGRIMVQQGNDRRDQSISARSLDRQGNDIRGNDGRDRSIGGRSMDRQGIDMRGSDGHGNDRRMSVGEERSFTPPLSQKFNMPSSNSRPVWNTSPVPRSFTPPLPPAPRLNPWANQSDQDQKQSNQKPNFNNKTPPIVWTSDNRSLTPPRTGLMIENRSQDRTPQKRYSDGSNQNATAGSQTGDKQGAWGRETRPTVWAEAADSSMDIDYDNKCMEIAIRREPSEEKEIVEGLDHSPPRRLEDRPNWRREAREGEWRPERSRRRRRRGERDRYRRDRDRDYQPGLKFGNFRHGGLLGEENINLTEVLLASLRGELKRDSNETAQQYEQYAATYANFNYQNYYNQQLMENYGQTFTDGQQYYVTDGQTAYITDGQNAYVADGQNAYMADGQTAYVTDGQGGYVTGEQMYAIDGQTGSTEQTRSSDRRRASRWGAAEDRETVQSNPEYSDSSNQGDAKQKTQYVGAPTKYAYNQYKPLYGGFVSAGYYQGEENNPDNSNHDQSKIDDHGNETYDPEKSDHDSRDYPEHKQGNLNYDQRRSDYNDGRYDYDQNKSDYKRGQSKSERDRDNRSSERNKRDDRDCDQNRSDRKHDQAYRDHRGDGNNERRGDNRDRKYDYGEGKSDNADGKSNYSHKEHPWNKKDQNLGDTSADGKKTEAKISPWEGNNFISFNK